MRLIKKKIKSTRELKDIIKKLRRHKYKVAFTNGCFDILHYGHINYLEKAKKFADVLIVAINSDESIRRMKGKGRPIISLKYRLMIVAALESVDFVTSFSQNTPLKIIESLKPDILIKGSDWDRHKIIGKDIVESYGGRVVTVPYIKGHSTTKIIKRVGKSF